MNNIIYFTNIIQFFIIRLTLLRINQLIEITLKFLN